MKKLIYLGLAALGIHGSPAFAQQAILGPPSESIVAAPSKVEDPASLGSPNPTPQATLGAPAPPEPTPADVAPYATFKEPKNSIFTDALKAVTDAFKAANAADCNSCKMGLWGDLEFLAWWTKGIPVNTPLFTQATSFPADPSSGSLGSKNTDIVLGGQSYNLQTRWGGRLTLGAWLDSEDVFGIETNYLYVSPQSTTQSVSTNGNAIYGFPYLNVNTGKETFISLTGPASLFGLNVSGNAGLRLSNFLEGTEVNMLVRLISSNRWDLIGLVGFRYVDFTEELDFNAGNAVASLGQSASLHDTFHAANSFYGGQIGLRGEYREGDFFIGATGKIAFGAMNQLVRVDGSFSESNPGLGAAGNFANVPGGFYALPTNIGHHSQSAFSVVPEFDIKIGYNLTRNLSAFVGYNFLYLSDVARPGTVIDHAINPTQSPGISGYPNTLTGPAAPNFAFSRSDFWAQGVNLGLRITY